MSKNVSLSPRNVASTLYTIQWVRMLYAGGIELTWMVGSPGLAIVGGVPATEVIYAAL